MKPVIALVGRPNVGKSTLFNCLTRSRTALVADRPGLTRDRIYGGGKVGGRSYIVVDTGGLSGAEAGIDGLMAAQSRQAMAEADVILFLVDGAAGLTAADELIADTLRRLGKPVFVVVNKTEGQAPQLVVAEFQALGLGAPAAIAAAHNRGVAPLMERVLATLPAAPEDEDEADSGIRVAVAGRPNVGKSTLVNRLLGEERVVVCDEAGTTRDSIHVPFDKDGRRYTLIDTAGVRRRARVADAIEKFSVIKTLQALEAAHVVVLVLDARAGLATQDLTLAGMIVDSGRALVIAINKWDGLSPRQRQQVKDDIDRRLPFLDFATRYTISALHGTGVGELFDSVARAYDAAMRQFPTPRLTRLLEDAVAHNPPPLARGHRVKLRYAHQGGRNPPLIVIHGTRTAALPAAYRRYLANVFRTHLQLMGTPVRLEFKTGANPYAGRRNKLTPRQENKRRRQRRYLRKQAR
ncbi:MAG TPA: ribosome biogenesis GTPase Der [Gammaproteobacteria bacterium]|nr:ribosome biogenesis GTPase Der [Gammaproteobacteria bacterium]